MDSVQAPYRTSVRVKARRVRCADRARANLDPDRSTDHADEHIQDRRASSPLNEAHPDGAGDYGRGVGQEAGVTRRSDVGCMLRRTVPAATCV